MPTINTILLPIDFRDASKQVVDQAAILARRFSAGIVLLHVVTPLSYSAGTLQGQYVPISISDLEQELVRSAQERLDASLAAEFQGLSIRRLLLKGDPARTIVETARRERADLVMMPTHGYDAFRRFLLGSVAAKVLHDCECPVWTGAHLQESSAHPFAIGNVLCAVDLSPHSAKTLQWAAWIASQFGARLKVVHVTAGTEPYGPGAYVVEPAWKESLVRSVNEKIAALQKELGTNAEVIIEGGDVAGVLSRLGEQAAADLLVIGRPSAGRLRSTGYGIIRESRIPVLSV